MTTEAFGRLASWSSFNIVVGRHDEFAHSRVAIPQKRGTTAKSIVLHFPHPTHSNWKPRKDAIPATPVTAITRGAVGCHAKIGKTRVASHTHWRKSTPNAPPPQSTTMTHFPPQSNTSHSRNPSLRGIAIERHAISSTHHNNRSYKYCLYISPFRTLWSQQALRQLFKRHGNYMKSNTAPREASALATLKANSARASSLAILAAVATKTSHLRPTSTPLFSWSRRHCALLVR